VHPFLPKIIYVDEAVSSLPLTRRVLAHFEGIKPQFIKSPDELKIPLSLDEAKETLLITRQKGEAIKSCQGMGDYVCCNYLTLSFISNCHFECTYCILQDYLKNNPIMTFYANVEEILESLESHLQKTPETIFRVGTGELSDSLALDDITHLSEELVPFAAKQKNLILELKTKSDRIDNLLNLDHQGRTVISWSVNPSSYGRLEELKCAPLEDRLQAARTVADTGYPVGFHFDPLLSFPDWKERYRELVEQIHDLFRPSEIAWVSLGSLRFTPNLKKIIDERFPQSRLLTGEIFPSKDGKMRYFREVREELYTVVKGYIEAAFPKVPNYLCMETKEVWKETYGTVPLNNMSLEKELSARFMV